ncbi:MAG: HNH endonuclease, partial [Anaerolineae bacterium]|nr:HNH endonuclease [Anaerolineae bacterium]
AFWTHQVDHIYAEKHGGETARDNLCLSCADCNRYKGSDLCSFDPASGEIVALFHPRRDVWQQHFRFDAGEIHALTPQGQITIRLLRLNDEERIVERLRLWRLGRYLPPGG